MCKIHTNSKQASIIRERIQTNAYSAQLTCSIVLNSDWSEKVFFSKFWQSNSVAGEWSKAGHKDLVLTTLLKASGRFWIQGETRQNGAKNTKLWLYLTKKRRYVIL